MGPSKRKGSVRRQVLDLNTREDSPSRPTWQTKYQHILPGDGLHQNGDSQSSSPGSKSNPLSGLLGNYNSDSDSEESAPKNNSNLDAKVEDFLKEIQSISAETSHDAQPNTSAQISQPTEQALYPSSVTAWQQCYDHNSGYPYYWNMETNEVTWEMPPELKAAIASVAMQQQQMQKQHMTQVQPQPKSKPLQETKKVCKYPWQTESDSEDEKIEMITSFGPQSDEESENEKELIKVKKATKLAKQTAVGPQLPLGHSDSQKIRSDFISLVPEDLEGLNESSYETSSLLTHGVQDTGPPGDDSFEVLKETASSKVVPVNKNEEAVSLPESNSTKILTSSESAPVTESNLQDNPENVEHKVSVTETVSETKPSVDSLNIADDVIAQIEKETPPDYQEIVKVEEKIEEQEKVSDQTDSKPLGIALIANYGDDSESEDNSFSEKRKSSSKLKVSPSKPLFPIEIPEEKVKPLFPCMTLGPVIEPRETETVQSEPEPITNIYNAEVEVEDPAVFKAFKRKKRIEFATSLYGPSTSKMQETKLPEVSCPSTQYNMDPHSNEHRGFGFSTHKHQSDTERKTFKNYGGIQFVKAETINLSEPKEKTETENNITNAPGMSSKESVRNDEIEDAATLLREKVTFLTGGKEEISPIQQMAIELETLFLAWQHGALTPLYLLKWLNEKCAELIRHEKAAAPSGWTCLWDRKNKRYYYRNTMTKAVQLEYPKTEEKINKMKEGDVESGEEMDICDTPPHLSPTPPESQTDVAPSTPPPPVISDVSETVSAPSPTPQPPPPPQISFHAESEPSTIKATKRKKRIADEIEESTEEVEEVSVASSPTRAMTNYDNEDLEKVETVAPPLPPLPPPPPPPPDDPPPPLPESPPPLSLNPDQPLPPGVDEPEYSLYRRVSPKHSYKKTQADSAVYSAELMMTYGYGLPVQQVVSSNGQPIAVPMQPLEYHAFMHESVSNPYLVQATPSSHVIHCPAKKPKPSLTSELVSFYSDLALLDSSSSGETTTETTPQAVPTTQILPPVVTNPVVTSSSTSVKSTECVTSNGVNVKKKKKAKATSGLSLKKKGVSSLVAKWQQVQEEVRKNFDDDEDDMPSAK